MGNFGDSGFDANSQENNVSNVIPQGEYEMVMVKSEKRATSAGDGYSLYTECKVTKGPQQNKVVIHRFNLWLNPAKDQAIQIAKGQLSQLCRAVGVLNPSDSSELHMKPFIAKINVKDSADYGPQNNITAFKPRPMSHAAVTSPPSTSSDFAGNSLGNPWG